MTREKQREIVIEFEKIQLIRKRATTSLSLCRECNKVTDIIELITASVLFESEPEDLFQFVKKNDCHFEVRDNNTNALCVASLLAKMQQNHEIRRLGARGE